MIRPDDSTRGFGHSETVGLIDSDSGVGTPVSPAPLVSPEEAESTFIDGKGLPTRFNTNRFGATTTTVNGLGRQTSIDRDSDSNPTKITRENGAVTTMKYDPLGNLTQVTDAQGSITTFEYEPTFNQVTSVMDPEENSTTIGHDANGNPIRIIDALGTETIMAYADPNCPGQLTSLTAAQGLPEQNITTFVYDPVTCNRVQTTDPLSNITFLAYDAAGNVNQVTDAEGRVTRFQYDALNRLTKVLDATLLPPDDPPCGNSGVTCYDYDDKGNLTQVTDAKGSITTYEYDIQDRLSKTTDPLVNFETFDYDANSNLISTTDRNGQTIDFRYSPLNQLNVKTLLPGTPGETITTFGYDIAGNLTSVRNAVADVVMVYDLANRLTSSETSDPAPAPDGGGDIDPSYTYDLNGNRLEMLDPTGTTFYTYDALNRLISMTNPSDNTTLFAYDALSRRTSMTHDNGVVATYTYDLASQLLSLGHTLLALPISDFSYTYDNVGNRTTLTQVRSAVAVASPLTYVYDELNRLIEATHPLPANPLETFDYDPVGNRELRDGQSFTSMFDAANRLLQDEDFCYSYDDNGNLTSKEAKVAGVCGGVGQFTEYEYDPESQLIEVRVDAAVIANYLYDGLGRRIEKDTGGAITRYLYDGEDILLEYDGANTQLARYTHGPGIDEPLIMERGSESFFYHADGLGSVTELTDSLGFVAQAYVYDSYGQVKTQFGVIPNPYTYTARELDTETGLYYYRARYYDPAVGRFLAEDSLLGNLVFPQSQNRYSRTFSPIPLSLPIPQATSLMWLQALFPLRLASL